VRRRDFLGRICFAGMTCALPNAWVLAANSPTKNRTEFSPSTEELDQTRLWLLANPFNGSNRGERRKRMAVIQSACDKLEPETYAEYVESWESSPKTADALEEKHPALYYLRKATAHAFEDIRKTKVKEGIAIWHIYNMGYVFKTGEKCFGIDVHARDAEKLADDLDFLLITHEHTDHWTRGLLEAMIAKGKPVITRWFEGSTIVNEPKELAFGRTKVRIEIGDHHPHSTNNMLMFEVDCGPKSGGFNIYHSGDGFNLQKMKPRKPVDVFIPHVSVGLNIEKTITKLDPDLTCLSHVLELGHSPLPPHAWRWSFDYAFSTVKNLPENRACVPTWGEKWKAEGRSRKAIEQ